MREGADAHQDGCRYRRECNVRLSAPRTPDDAAVGDRVSVQADADLRKPARAFWARFKDPVDQNLPPPLLFFQIEKPKSDTITRANTAPPI